MTGDPFLRMDGQAVFKFAVRVLGEVAGEVLDEAGLTSEDVDWLIPHQANVRIIQATAKRLGLPMERVITTVGEHGNTSAASIPLALDKAVRDGRVQRGHRLVLEGVGGALPGVRCCWRSEDRSRNNHNEHEKRKGGAMAFALVFPGQGSQSVGMMAAYGESAVIRDTFVEASEALGEDLWQMATEGPTERLAMTVNTQPLMLTAGVAVYRAWCAAAARSLR